MSTWALEYFCAAGGLIAGVAIGALFVWYQYRKPRHVHNWTPWEDEDFHGVNTRTGVEFTTTRLVRSCKTCGWEAMAKIR